MELTPRPPPEPVEISPENAAKPKNSKHRRNTAGLKPPWKKGQCGNPAGRGPGAPKQSRTFTEICREFMDGSVSSTDPRTRLEVLVTALFSQALKGNTKATAVMLDRLDPILRDSLTINNNTIMGADQVREMLDRVRMAPTLQSRLNGNGSANGNGH